MKSNTRFFFLLILTCLLLPLPGVAGNVRQIEQINPAVDIEVLKSRIKEVEASTSRDEERKSKLTEQYRKAITQIEKSRTFKNEAEAFRQARINAPAEQEDLEQKLERFQQISAEDSLQISEKASLSEIEQLLQKEQADLAAVEAKLSEIRERISLLEVRPAVARDRLIVAQQDLEAVVEESKLIPTVNGTDETQARSWVLQSQALALSNEIKMLDQELLSSKARAELLQLRLEEAEFNVSYVSTRVKMLEELVNMRRLAEAEQFQLQAEAFKEGLESTHPLVIKLAEQNVALGEDIKQRALQLEQLVSEDDQTRKSNKRIANDLDTAKQKLEIAGLSQALGQVLQKQRGLLPEIEALKSDASKREKLIANAGLRQIQYADEIRKLRNKEEYFSTVTQNLPQDEAQSIRSEIEKLNTYRIELLDRAIQTESTYLNVMAELDFSKRQLIKIIERYEDFLGKRLLWIRSTDPVSLESIKSLPTELKVLTTVSNWTSTTSIFIDQLVANPIMFLSFIGLVILTGMRNYFLKSAIATGQKIGYIRSDKLSYTMMALGWTLLASASLPVLLMFCGWQLALAGDLSGFALGVAKGLNKAGKDLLELLFFADICIAGGLAIKHFR